MSWNETAWFSFLIGTALKSTVVLGVAWLATLAMGRRSAAARHLVWTAAAVAVLALPMLSISLPAWPVSGPPLPLADVLFRVDSVASTPADNTLEARALAGTAAAPPAAPWRPGWRLGVMLLWAAGAAIGLGQMFAAMASLWRTRRKARPFTALERPELAHALGIRQRVDILEAETGAMPMTFGLVRSAISVPANAVEWSEERRRIVLLHELAHVRRGDVATHLLARTALALNWWNPLAWTAWRQFLKERERAADDLVLACGAKASDYAGHLLEVARAMQTGRVTAWAAIAMARPSQLEGRLLAILDSRTDRRSPGRASAWLAALMAVALAAPIAALHAQDATVSAATQAEVDATIRAALAQKNHEILEQAASGFENQRKFDTAQKLLDSALTIRGERYGDGSLEYGMGLLKIADLEQKRSDVKTAEKFYAKAATVLGDRPEASRALIQMGIAALLSRDYDRATENLQHAQRIDPSSASQSLMWQAVVREHQKRIDEAAALYQSSLALQDPQSTQAATTMQLYARLQEARGNTDEAADYNARAAAVRKANQATAAPKAAASGGVYRVGGGVSAPVLLHKVDPAYSEEARAAKFQGTVLVQVEVGPDGFAHNIKVARSLGLGLDEKAVEAVSQWQFKPGVKDGQPVTVMAMIEVNFKLL